MNVKLQYIYSFKMEKKELLEITQKKKEQETGTKKLNFILDKWSDILYPTTISSAVKVNSMMLQ